MAEELSDARLRVIHAAEELFAQRGYTAVTMQDIARELGIKAASLYYHFPGGKEELFASVYEHAFHRHAEGVQTVIDDAGEGLHGQVQAVLTWFARERPLNILAMIHSDMPALTEETQARVMHAFDQALFRKVAHVFEAAMARGESRPVDTYLMAGIMMAIIDSIKYAGPENQELAARLAIAEQVTDILVHGLRPRPDEDA